MYPCFIAKWPAPWYTKDAVEFEPDTLVPKKPEAGVGKCKEILEWVKELFPNIECQVRNPITGFSSGFRFLRPLFECAFRLVPKWSQTDLFLNYSKNLPPPVVKEAPATMCADTYNPRPQEAKDGRITSLSPALTGLSLKTKSRCWSYCSAVYCSCHVMWLPTTSSRGILHI